VKDNYLHQEITDWVKKTRYELKYMEELLERQRLDRTSDLYIELEELKVSLNKFIKNLRKEVKNG
jgi:hypothetical protein